MMCILDLQPSVGADRLILRSPTLADAPVIAELANDLGVTGMTASMPYPYGIADAEAHLVLPRV